MFEGHMSHFEPYTRTICSFWWLWMDYILAYANAGSFNSNTFSYLPFYFLCVFWFAVVMVFFSLHIYFCLSSTILWHQLIHFVCILSSISNVHFNIYKHICVYVVSIIAIKIVSIWCFHFAVNWHIVLLFKISPSLIVQKKNISSKLTLMNIPLFHLFTQMNRKYVAGVKFKLKIRWKIPYQSNTSH